MTSVRGVGVAREVTLMVMTALATICGLVQVTTCGLRRIWLRLQADLA
eukprot:SAG11_NODE_2351_length_3481_cov_3.345062_2_plen_48_part_00